MGDKKAFVFDTNFIIQNKKLDEVVMTLSGDYSVYVTQVSIDERIAQQCRDLKNKYSEVERCQREYSHFATITFKKSFENECDYYKKGIQENYNNLFAEKIIPLKKAQHYLTLCLKG